LALEQRQKLRRPLEFFPWKNAINLAYSKHNLKHNALHKIIIHRTLDGSPNHRKPLDPDGMVV
jgi:hypothetical protein